MKKYLEQLIPNLYLKQYEDYILHINNNAVAWLITKDKNSVINTIIEENNEITEIKLERNFFGATDIRICCRKRSR